MQTLSNITKKTIQTYSKKILDICINIRSGLGLQNATPLSMILTAPVNLVDLLKRKVALQSTGCSQDG